MRDQVADVVVSLDGVDDARRILHEVAAAVQTWRDVARRWLPPSEVEAMAPAFAALDTVPGEL